MKTILPFLLSLLLLFVSSINLAADTVTLKNTEGKEITVTLLSATTKQVTFTLPPNKNKMTYALDKLDKPSQTIIRKWLREGGKFSKDLVISDYSSKKTNTRISNNYYYDYERGSTVSPKVSLINRDPDRISGKGTIHVITLGSPVRYKSTTCLLNQQKINFADIPPNRTKEFSGESFTFSYDNDYGTYGAKYKGYIIIVCDEKGKVITTQASKDSLLEVGTAKLLKLKKKTAYDKYWKELKGVSVRTNRIHRRY